MPPAPPCQAVVGNMHCPHPTLHLIIYKSLILINPGEQRAPVSTQRCGFTHSCSFLTPWSIRPIFSSAFVLQELFPQGLCVVISGTQHCPDTSQGHFTAPARSQLDKCPSFFSALSSRGARAGSRHSPASQGAIASQPGDVAKANPQLTLLQAHIC